MHEVLLLAPSSNKIRTLAIRYRGRTETFKFPNAAICKKYAFVCSNLASCLSERPADGIAASTQLQLIKDFEKEWGTDKMPARAVKAKAILMNLACLPSSAVTPGHESS